MSRHAPAVFRAVGALLHVPAAMAAVSIVPAAVFGEGAGVVAFLATGVVAALCGQSLFRAFRDAPEPGTFHAAIATALAWLCIALLCTIPFVVLGQGGAEGGGGAAVFSRPSNALFEAFSGITGTGLTVAPDPSALPRSLQWWRSLSEWVGGLGIVVAVATVLSPGPSGYRLFQAEARRDKILPSIRSTVRTIGLLYSLFTLAAIGGLLLAGRPVWESINHGLTTISTGGFTITPDSVRSQAWPARSVLTIAMIAGAVSFQAHYRVIAKRRPREMLRRMDHRVLWILLLAGAGLLLAVAPSLAGGRLGDTLFDWTSAVTTTGLSAGDFSSWPVSAKLLAVVAMTIGGEAGATVGGIKISRVSMLTRGLVWRLASIGRTPREVPAYRIDGRPVPGPEAHFHVRGAALLVSLWVATLAVATLALAVASGVDRPLEDLLFEAASAQGNVGLSVGIVSADLAPAAKGVLCLVMWLGRLEIIPAMVLVTSPFVLARRTSGNR